MNKASEVFNFINYYLFSKTKFDIHSPFVYDFVINVLEDKRDFYAYKEIKSLKQQLLQNRNFIQVNDLGAGSKIKEGNNRRICDMAKNSSKSEKIGQLLFRIAAYYKPENMLELGTSFGLSTLYLHNGRRSAKIITIEGCAKTAEIAAENFKYSGSTIDLRIASFEEALLPALKDLKKVDLVFLDGNHRYQPTIDYFHTILPYIHQDSIIIFDDINWSLEMKAAWKEIKSHPDVKVVIDLYHIGILLFRKEQKREEFSIFY